MQAGRFYRIIRKIVTDDVVFNVVEMCWCNTDNTSVNIACVVKEEITIVRLQQMTIWRHGNFFSAWNRASFLWERVCSSRNNVLAKTDSFILIHSHHFMLLECTTVFFLATLTRYLFFFHYHQSRLYRFSLFCCCWPVLGSCIQHLQMDADTIVYTTLPFSI